MAMLVEAGFQARVRDRVEVKIRIKFKVRIMVIHYLSWKVGYCLGTGLRVRVRFKVSVSFRL